MKIDYDRIAAEYARHRKVHPGVLRDLLHGMRYEMLQAGELSAGSSVLEVGCGTGNYIGAIQSAVGCTAWGIDPSEQMLAHARQHSQNVTFLQGSAERLPVPDDSFDLVFSVDVIHHVKDREGFIQEAARVLKSGGRFCIVTEDEALISTRVPLASYFPETIAVDQARYPRIGDLIDQMQAAGFSGVQQVVVRQPYEIIDLRPFETRSFSCLHLIPEAAFQRGLARLRADLERGPIQAVSHNLLLWGLKTGR